MQQSQFNSAFSWDMFKRKTSMTFILLILWFNKSGDFVMYRLTSANQKASQQFKMRLAQPVLFNGFAGKHLSCNNIFSSRNTVYGLSVLDQRSEWFKINYKFQFKDHCEIFCPPTGITNYSQQQILLNFI